MMHQREHNTIRGEVDIILRDRAGKTVKKMTHHNLITSSGKMLLANIFRGTEKQGVSHIGVGSGGTKPSPADDGLENEILPRKEFDQNIIQEENNAFLILKDNKNKDVIKLTSKLSGEGGNNTSVEVKFITARRKKDQKVNIYVVNTEEDLEESFEDLSIDPEGKHYLIEDINENSQLISASIIEERLPDELEKTALSGGSDIIVTLSSTFGYDDANGKLTEAGIFNSDNQGVMYNRVVFPEISKTDKFTLSLIWKISF
jgi:hypothetical protein